MSADQTQKCPLCSHLATYEIFHDPYCKHFTCQVCGGFCIDEHSEIYLKTAPEDFDARARARNPASKLSCFFRRIGFDCNLSKQKKRFLSAKGAGRFHIS